MTFILQANSWSRLRFSRRNHHVWTQTFARNERRRFLAPLRISNTAMQHHLRTSKPETLCNDFQFPPA